MAHIGFMAITDSNGHNRILNIDRIIMVEEDGDSCVIVYDGGHDRTRFFSLDSSLEEFMDGLQQAANAVAVAVDLNREIEQ